MKNIKIKDNAGDRIYKMDKLLQWQSFHSATKSHGMKFIKAADIVIKKGRKPEYGYLNKTPLWNQSSGWVYTIVVNGMIVKIGQTDSTLGSRFSSYQAGTRENRMKGTCSVTNWYCSEFIRSCHKLGYNISVYAYSIPHTETIIKIFGKKKKARNKHAYLYENAMLSEHQRMLGSLPILCRNNSEV